MTSANNVHRKASAPNPQCSPGGEKPSGSNFMRDIIVRDLGSNKFTGRVQTRFPREPNGYLHIGHAKAIYLDFGLADEFLGHTNLRFDDTNPTKEDTEYVDSIENSVRWLGCHWDGLYYAEIPARYTPSASSRQIKRG